MRESNHTDSSCRDLLCDFALAVCGLQRQGHAMARRDAMSKPAVNHAFGEILQGTNRRIVVYNSFTENIGQYSSASDEIRRRIDRSKLKLVGTVKTH